MPEHIGFKSVTFIVQELINYGCGDFVVFHLLSGVVNYSIADSLIETETEFTCENNL